MVIDKLIKSHVFWPEIENNFSRFFNFSESEIKDVFSSVEEEMIAKNKINLSSEVLKFYAYNDYFHNLRIKRAGFLFEEDLIVFNDYKKFLDEFSKKIFGYLLYSSISEAHHQESIDPFSRKSSKTAIQVEDKEFLDYKFYHKKMREEFYEEESVKHILNKSSKLFDSAQNFFGKNVVLNKLIILPFIENNYSIPEIFKDKFLNQYNRKMYYYKDLLNVKKDYTTLIKSENRQSFENLIGFIINCGILIGGKGHDSDHGEFQKQLIKSEYVHKDHHIDSMNTKDFLKNLRIFLSNGFDSGYAGENWQFIIDHMLKYVNGEINTEVFVDQALSLEHNNGNIFDKDFIFSKDTSHFKLSFITNNGRQRPKAINTLNFVFSLQTTGQIVQFLKCDFQKTLSNLKIKNENLYKTTYQCIEDLESLRNSLLYSKDNNLSKIMDLNDNADGFDFKKVIDAYIKTTKNTELDELIKKSSKFYDALSSAFITTKELKNNPKNIQSHFKLIDLTEKIQDKLSAESIGSKAMGLFELNKKGYRVPKAVVFDVKTSQSYLNDKVYFNNEFNKIKNSLNSFGYDPDGSPIMVSVRSGAAISMPGMMDTILNVGIDDERYSALCKKYGIKIIDKCAVAFIGAFVKSKWGIELNLPKDLDESLLIFKEILRDKKVNFKEDNKFPIDYIEQLRMCVSSVFDSLNNQRMQVWKDNQGISDIGTAAIVQKMVLGNKNNMSLTAVVFSRDCITGDKKIIGEYLTNSQGEDLVSGKVSPKNIDLLKEKNSEIYNEICKIARDLEKSEGVIQDIELTVEDSVVYVLQKRGAVSSMKAKLSLAKELNSKISSIINVNQLMNQKYVDTNKVADFKGFSANEGVISGVVVNSHEDIAKYKVTGKPLIFVSEEASPDNVPEMIKTDGFITRIGGITSHAAIIARSLDKPCIIGAKNINLKPGKEITMNAQTGEIWTGILPIRINKKESEDLAKKIIIENDLIIKDENVEFKKLKLESWNSSLSKSKQVGNIKNNKYDDFLSLNQVAASLYLLKDLKNNKRSFKK